MAIRSREGTGRLSWKPFIVQLLREMGCAEAQTLETSRKSTP
jgi:hypothetical protein